MIPAKAAKLTIGFNGLVLHLDWQGTNGPDLAYGNFAILSHNKRTETEQLTQK